MWSKLNYAFGIVVFAIVVSLSGCTKHSENANDPKRRLTDYINVTFSVKKLDDRAQLMAYLTGDAKKRLEAWSEDQFRSAFMDTKRQFLKLVFNEVKQVSSEQLNVTYEIIYLDQNKGHDAKVTDKKLCQMINENGTWFIKNVHNIKELIEYRNEMSL